MAVRDELAKLQAENVRLIALLELHGIDWQREPIPSPPPAEPLRIGVYPLLEDDTCYFLAADFDEAEWRDDARAFAHSCEELGIPAALEISRSGKGAHVLVAACHHVDEIAKFRYVWLTCRLHRHGRPGRAKGVIRLLITSLPRSITPFRPACFFPV